VFLACFAWSILIGGLCNNSESVSCNLFLILADQMWEANVTITLHLPCDSFIWQLGIRIGSSRNIASLLKTGSSVFYQISVGSTPLKIACTVQHSQCISSNFCAFGSKQLLFRMSSYSGAGAAITFVIYPRLLHAMNYPAHENKSLTADNDGRSK